MPFGVGLKGPRRRWPNPRSPFHTPDTRVARVNAFTPADLGVDVNPRLKTLKVIEPPKRQSGVKVETVAELVAKLKNEAKVI